MTKENQKILYEHYKAVANNEKKDKGNKDFKPVIRANCKRYAAEILASFPEFDVKPKPKGGK